MSPQKDRCRSMEIKNCQVMLVGTVKGLLSEREIVRSVSEMFGPEAFCLHISREEIEGLKAVVQGKVKETGLSMTEKIYAREMSKFGEVQIPPPSLVEACRISIENEIPLEPLDMDENSYSTLYTELIGGATLVRQSLRLKSINRRRFEAATPEDLVIEWDRVINRFKGFKRLEERREKNMASRIRAISSRYSRILAVLEYERMEGIISHLSG
ncbi:MAG: hypothetical protein JW939_09640 [Candidatus Thermoplasmatota archaeon]|nr:hypothetical protein [Candidatus Thermoplasmatota archaeon]